MSEHVRFWRYALPSIQAEGWAIIVIGSDGFFAAVSDFGNYVYRWTHPGLTEGQDFRHFVLNVNWQYLMTKLRGKPDEYDADATVIEIKKEVISVRRSGGRSKQARWEWDLLEQRESETGLDTETGFNNWVSETHICDAYELRVNRWPADVRTFGEKILPRLKEAIQAELKID